MFPVPTKPLMLRVLVMCRCLQHSEPALLVGDTGTGKTTVCQMLALMRGQKLHIINCNQHTETSDFLGGYRPIRYVAQTCAHFMDMMGSQQHQCNTPCMSHLCITVVFRVCGLQTVVFGTCNHHPGGFTASHIAYLCPCILVCQLMGCTLKWRQHLKFVSDVQQSVLQM